MTCRILSLILATVLLLGLCACGTGNAQPTGTAAPTGTTAAPTEPKRELTAVGEPMRHLSYNIAGSLGTERLQMFYMEGREAKKNNIKAIIEELDPDTISLQEASEDWREGLGPFLDDKYAVVGKTHEEVPTPEFWLNPVLYKVDTFNCLDEGVIFLSETYEKSGSRNRSCSYALLERKSDGELVFVMSVHVAAGSLGTQEMHDTNYREYYVDDANVCCYRDEQVAVLRKFVDEKLPAYAATYGKEITVILSGDFNIDCWTDEKFSNEYSRLLETMKTHGDGAPPLFESGTICKELVPNQTRKTWQTYRLTDSEMGAYLRLDYVFVSDNVIVDQHVCYNTPYEVRDSSDHHPVYTDYTIGH